MQDPLSLAAAAWNGLVAAYLAALPATLEDFLGSAALAAAILLFECACLGWPRSSLRALLRDGSGSVRNDLWTFLLLGLGLGWPLSQLALLGLPEATKQTLQHWAGALPADAGPPLAVALAWFVIYDFLLYWLHRWSHTVPALWALHAYHHSAGEMTVLTRFRFHPLEAALYTVVFAATLAWLPVPRLYLLALMGASIAHTCLKHSRLTGDWGWLGRYLLASPASHHVHHSRDEAHFGSNYATTFQFWDICFGSHRLPGQTTVAALRLGLADDDGGRPQWTALLDHYLRFLRGLLPRLRRRQPS